MAQPASGGFSFADFLLGLPQQAAVQAGLAKSYLRANVMDLYANDDWRILPNLTLNYGLSYEYFAPYTEKDDRLVNLDHSADFKQVSRFSRPERTVQWSVSAIAGQSRSHDVCPAFGFAYRPKGAWFKETVIRGGYGINYNTQQSRLHGSLPSSRLFPYPDQRCGRSGLRRVSTGQCLQLLDGRRAEQLQREPELSSWSG